MNNSIQIQFRVRSIHSFLREKKNNENTNRNCNECKITMYPFWKIFIYDYVLDLQIVQNCSYIGKRISPTRDCHCSLTIHFSTLFCCKIFSISGGGVGMAHLFTVTRNSLKYYFETSTLNVSRLNHGDFLPAFFCVLLRRFASRISELLFEWHWREFPIAVSSIKSILFLVLFRIFLFIFSFLSRSYFENRSNIEFESFGRFGTIYIEMSGKNTNRD